ncbi:MAG TPA: hypothetical protein VHX88_09115 [Solirubrobacteraceae bacterium]|jgi:hypothetical protein|nr:hypothetical protein [Solirubrobacteraceae bacterium]
MYQFSRAIFRELAPHIEPGPDSCASQQAVLRACEATIERLATDRHYFARPSRTLFNEIRSHFPMSDQAYVWRVVSCYVDCAREFVIANPFAGLGMSGEPAQCRATTRKGTACQRAPLPHNGYCPSHQHLAETEDGAALAA